MSTAGFVARGGPAHGGARRRRGAPVSSPPAAAARRAAPLLALALAATACSKDLTVTVRAGDRPPDPDHGGSSAAVVGTAVRSPLAAGIAVDRLRFVLRDLRFQANPTSDGSSAPDDASIAPPLVLVDLGGERLSPGAMTEVVPARSVSWKSFYQTVVNLAPVTAGEAAADPALEPLLNRTLVIEGRLPGGLPFTYASDVAEVLIRPAVFRVGTNHNNLTLNVAPNRWFEGPGGEPLDPLDPAAASSIEANVLESIDFYMDDNRDGNPDFLG